jgi:hypothetical protein
MISEQTAKKLLTLPVLEKNNFPQRGPMIYVDAKAFMQAVDLPESVLDKLVGLTLAQRKKREYHSETHGFPNPMPIQGPSANMWLRVMVHAGRDLTSEITREDDLIDRDKAIDDKFKRAALFFDGLRVEDDGTTRVAMKSDILKDIAAGVAQLNENQTFNVSSTAEALLKKSVAVYDSDAGSVGAPVEHFTLSLYANNEQDLKIIANQLKPYFGARIENKIASGKEALDEDKAYVEHWLNALKNEPNLDQENLEGRLQAERATLTAFKKYGNRVEGLYHLNIHTDDWRDAKVIQKFLDKKAGLTLDIDGKDDVTAKMAMYDHLLGKTV